MFNTLSWAELFAIPNFDRGPIAPSVMTTGRLVQAYHMDQKQGKQPCGMDCQTPHYFGYLVELPDGRISNVGHNCGKKHFGAQWTVQTGNVRARAKAVASATAVRERRAEALLALKETPGISAAELERGRAMLAAFEALPKLVKEKLETRARENDGVLHKQRPPSAVELAEAAKNKTHAPMVAVYAAKLVGLRGIHPQKRFDVQLDRIQGRRSALETALARESASADELSAEIRQLREANAAPAVALEELRQFFSESNLANLRYLEFRGVWSYRHVECAGAPTFRVRLVE